MFICFVHPFVVYVVVASVAAVVVAVVVVVVVQTEQTNDDQKFDRLKSISIEKKEIGFRQKDKTGEPPFCGTSSS